MEYFYFTLKEEKKHNNHFKFRLKNTSLKLFFIFCSELHTMNQSLYTMCR